MRDGDVTLWTYAAWAIAKCQKRLGTFPCSIIDRALCRSLFTAVSAAPTEKCSSFAQTTWLVRCSVRRAYIGWPPWSVRSVRMYYCLMPIVARNRRYASMKWFLRARNSQCLALDHAIRRLQSIDIRLWMVCAFCLRDPNRCLAKVLMLILCQMSFPL